MDFKSSLNLPKTDFPMKGDLAKKEPVYLADWEKSDLYSRILASRKGRPRFVLHDGPPFANGRIHYGHILNKTLKDLVIKSKTMAGFLCPYVPGWDCHGLPIELQVEKERAGASTTDVEPPGSAAAKVAIIEACHAYASKFIGLQKEGFQRLGVLGDWEHPYLTLEPGYCAELLRGLATLAGKGYLYKGRKPVYWCPTDRTSLAEAEVEYAEHVSPSVFVKFPFSPEQGLPTALKDRSVFLVIWTTTPWTLPANVAVAINPKVSYVAMVYGKEAYVVAEPLAGQVRTACGLGEPEATLPVLLPERSRARHPFYERDSIVIYGDHVTLDAGTGLVHTAPGHGQDDYEVGLRYGLEVIQPVDDRGRFDATVAEWKGLHVFKANPLIVDTLAASGRLLNQPGDKLSHSYPHCWRCKGPILFRATPQWFLSMAHEGLRGRVLEEIDRTTFVPPWGRNRIYAMIENRPDWCLSRQRVWGVPIPAFDCEDCGEEMAKAEWIAHVADIIERESITAWYKRSPAELLPAGAACGRCGGTRLRKEEVIVDVWFESGSSWKAVCEPNAELGVPVDLYLEGSDQHRGWFHTSLLTGVSIRGGAPYRAVLTHGFVLDENGHPYSKSEIQKAIAAGKKIEYIPPEDVIRTGGAEVLRLWVASEDFRSDVRYSRGHLNQLGDSYKKLRNTLRFLLANLFDFNPTTDAVATAELDELDAMALERLQQVIADVRKAYEAYEFHAAYRSLLEYATVDLSALYLDGLKDRLYCDRAAGLRRRSSQTVLYAILRGLTTLLAPILCFTADEVWKHMPKQPGDPDSVHIAEFPTPSAPDEALRGLATQLLAVRADVLASLESFRREGNKSLDAKVTVMLSPNEVTTLAPHASLLAELCIVSQVVLQTGEHGETPARRSITVGPADGDKCPRCWRWTVLESGPGQRSTVHPDLCSRCQEALS